MGQKPRLERIFNDRVKTITPAKLERLIVYHNGFDQERGQEGPYETIVFRRGRVVKRFFVKMLA